jgi:hypothetical protein
LISERIQERNQIAPLDRAELIDASEQRHRLIERSGAADEDVASRQVN